MRAQKRDRRTKQRVTEKTRLKRLQTKKICGEIEKTIVCPESDESIPLEVKSFMNFIIITDTQDDFGSHLRIDLPLGKKDIIILPVRHT